MTARGALWRNRRGMSRLGCLFTLLILVFGGYYAVNIGGVFLDYYRLLDEMKANARLATNLNDQTIMRRILAKVDELGLPDEARKVSIRRTARPREIRIMTSYEVTLELPFIAYTVQFNPEARQPL
ncbi:MAG: hypothetical protein ACE5PT_04445 [Gemmatimonadales bacterium]